MSSALLEPLESVQGTITAEDGKDSDKSVKRRVRVVDMFGRNNVGGQLADRVALQFEQLNNELFSGKEEES